MLKIDFYRLTYCNHSSLIEHRFVRDTILRFSKQMIFGAKGTITDSIDHSYIHMYIIHSNARTNTLMIYNVIKFGEYLNS